MCQIADCPMAIHVLTAVILVIYYMTANIAKIHSLPQKSVYSKLSFGLPILLRIFFLNSKILLLRICANF